MILLLIVTHLTLLQINISVKKLLKNITVMHIQRLLNMIEF